MIVEEPRAQVAPSRPYSTEAIDRLPYAATGAEQRLLGLLLSDNRIYERVKAILGPEHFHSPSHAQIYRIIARRIEAGSVADADSVQAELGAPGDLDAVVGAARFIAPTSVPENLLLDLATFEAERILAAFQSLDDQSDREARALLDRINSGLDEAHARADRLLARLA